MEFIVIAFDGTDDAAEQRRLAARPDHIALGNAMRDEGRMRYGVAILDDDERMIGSVVHTDFPDRPALDEWLAREPYVVGNVWNSITVHPCQRRHEFLPELRADINGKRFVVLGLDGSGPDASARRARARPEHLATGADLLRSGHMLYGAALTDTEGRMNGSILIVGFPSREALDEWLRREPYVTAAVWERVDVRPCRIGPSFVGLHPSP